jgi:hypothetical protein
MGPFTPSISIACVKPVGAQRLDLRPIKIVRTSNENIHAAAVIGLEYERQRPKAREGVGRGQIQCAKES